MTKRRRAKSRAADSAFWGRPTEPGQGGGHGQEGGQPTSIRPTDDPAAVPRSLGEPPLAVNPEVAERHLYAVYEEAVRTATALAAANGLLSPPEEGDGSL